MIPVAPYPIPGAPGNYALHMISGSAINAKRDVVLLARRMLHYLRTVYPKATVEHLVNRFGADQREAIGLLVGAMAATGVLVEHSPSVGSEGEQDQPCYEAVSEDHEGTRLLDLRQNYAELVEREKKPRFCKSIA